MRGCLHVRLRVYVLVNANFICVYFRKRKPRLFIFFLFLSSSLVLLQSVCGSPVLDFEALEKVTEYEGYHKNHQSIKWFW